MKTSIRGHADVSTPPTSEGNPTFRSGIFAPMPDAGGIGHTSACGTAPGVAITLDETQKYPLRGLECSLSNLISYEQYASFGLPCVIGHVNCVGVPPPVVGPGEIKQFTKAWLASGKEHSNEPLRVAQEIGEPMEDGFSLQALVQDILRFDALTFKSLWSSVTLNYYHDMPGSYIGINSTVHRDLKADVQPDNWFDLLKYKTATRALLQRHYLMRTYAPTEYLKDAVGVDANGRRLVAETYGSRCVTPSQRVSLDRLRRGFGFQGKPGDVVLKTELTIHWSCIPDRPSAARFVFLLVSSNPSF